MQYPNLSQNSGNWSEYRIDVIHIRNNLPELQMQLLWQIRRKIVAQLDSAPLEKQAALRASLRGIDMLLRRNFDYRHGGRFYVWRN